MKIFEKETQERQETQETHVINFLKPIPLSTLLPFLCKKANLLRRKRIKDLLYADSLKEKF